MSQSASENTSARTRTRTRTSLWFSASFYALVLPVLVAAILYRLEPFQPVLLPVPLSPSTVVVPARNNRVLRGAEAVAQGQVQGPEDLAYDAATRVIYTGCEDGWIKRFTVNDSVADSVVEKWVNTGGRPLGIALKRNGDLIVADAQKGLLRVTSEKEVELLVDEFEGLKFKLTDEVDIGDDGTIYFTDASHKYSLKDALLDILEGKPNGRLLSYNPATKKTTLLVQNLYFANGVAVSPDQQFVVFCESVLMRCNKYHLQGPKKGTIEKFCDVPGMPDNIHYDDGQRQYLIAIFTALAPELDIAYRYPFIRKAVAIVMKYVLNLSFSKNGGVLVVDLEGKPTAHYYDLKLGLTSAVKIGNHIYGGSILYPFVTRLDIEKYPALPTV
ncbi:protein STRICTOSIDINE SYNTHASE-LIKE 5 [Cajanus cajan]|nr:protein STRICTOSIDINE SYNTHASE-LIKE 5 [Cajanus cajan]